MGIKYITIEREYGSGGTEIARRLAAELGIPCYGRELLEYVAEEQGISVSEIERYEENVTGSFLYSVYMMSQAANGKADMLAREGHIFVAEQTVIQQLAKQGRCIFIGHCAAEALKAHEGVVSVFIRSSDEAAKKARIVSEYGVAENAADKTRKAFDKKRANYYYANTTRRWDELKNYNVVLDSAVLGIDGCVSALKALLKAN